MYKVYRHRTETDGRVFYIGCGKTNNRPYNTYKGNRSKEWFDIYENEGLIVEIVLETENKGDALELESLLIQEYKRICDGGTLINKSIFDCSKGKILSYETKQRMSKIHKGKILSDETKQRMSKAKKDTKHSEVTKKKIGEGNSKPILQYNKDGTFIKVWKSVTEAGDSLNINKGNITSCCKSKRNFTGGFIWKYKED